MNETLSYTKFKVGFTYFVRIASHANKKVEFTCTAVKEGKVKGSYDGKKEKWYDIELRRALRGGQLCEIEMETFKPDKRLSNYVTAKQVVRNTEKEVN